MPVSFLGRLRASAIALLLIATWLPPGIVNAAVIITSDDAATTNEDHALVISVLGNDLGIGLTIAAITQGSSGSVAISGGGTTVTYAPHRDAHGTDTFTYTAHDSDGHADAATVTVTVSPVNDPPVARNDPSPGCNEPSDAFGGSFPMPEDHGVITLIAGSGGCSLDANDTDVDGDELIYQLVSGPSHASTFVFDADGSFQYKPVSDYSTNAGDWVSDSFDYRVSDGTVWSPPATMRLWIAEINDPPTFNLPANVTVNEDAPAQNRAFATLVSPGPASEAGQSVTFRVTPSDPSLFAVQPTISATGRLTYTPRANANGLTLVEVVATDDGGLEDFDVFTVVPDDTSDPKTFTIAINPVDDPPTATDDRYTVLEDGLADLAIRDNDTHVDGTATIVSALTHGAKGDTSLDGPSRIRYEPTPDANGTDTFTYTLRDEDGDTDTATVTMTITPVNDPPSFTPGANLTVAEDAGPQTFPGWAKAIKVGPADEVAAQTPKFTITGNTNPALFEVQPALAPNGTLTFAPATDANGIATLTIQLSDGSLAVTAIRTITVTPVNDPPVFAATADLEVGEDGGPRTFTGWATHISVGPADEAATQAPTFTVTGNSNPDIFAAPPAVSPAGTLTFAPKANAFGTATMTVSLSDGLTSVARPLSITIVPGADPPNAVNDVGITIPALSAATAIPVLGNDLDPDPGEALTITRVTQPAKGVVAITGAGTGLTYTPRGCSVGSDTFTYTIRDAAGATDTATVLLAIDRDRVKPTAATPGATFLTGTTMGSTIVPVRVSWCATDPGSGVARYHVLHSTDLGAFEPVRLGSPAATSTVRTMSIGHRYRYKVRGVDGDGSVGAFATGPLWGVGRSQESSAAITWSSGWSPISSSTASGGKLRSTSRAGAHATIALTGRAVALVGPVSATRGSFRVYLDGKLVATATQRSSTSAPRRILFARTMAPGAHTLRIEAVGNGRVELDAFLTLS